MANEHRRPGLEPAAPHALGEFLMREGDAARVLDGHAAADRVRAVAAQAARSALLSDAISECIGDAPKSSGRTRRPAEPSERIEYRSAAKLRKPARRDTLVLEPRVAVSPAVDPRRQVTELSARHLAPDEDGAALPLEKRTARLVVLALLVACGVVLVWAASHQLSAVHPARAGVRAHVVSSKPPSP